MDELSTLAKEENDRILEVLKDSGVKETKINSLQPIIENVAWMKVKLDVTRDAIKTSNVVIPYDNGGGQKGLRENPLFKGYEALWKSYMQGMNRILDCLPPEKFEEEAEVVERPATMLELVRNKHKKEA